MNKWEDLQTGGTAHENPDRYSSRQADRRVEREIDNKANQVDGDENPSEVTTLDDMKRNGKSPKERWGALPDAVVEKLAPAIQRIIESANGQSPEMQKEIFFTTLKELAKDIEQTGPALQRAEKLAGKPKSEGLKKSGQANRPGDAKPDYSRSRNGDAVNKEDRKKDKAHQRARERKRSEKHHNDTTAPDW